MAVVSWLRGSIGDPEPEADAARGPCTGRRGADRDDVLSPVGDRADTEAGRVLRPDPLGAERRRLGERAEELRTEPWPRPRRTADRGMAGTVTRLGGPDTASQTRPLARRSSAGPARDGRY